MIKQVSGNRVVYIFLIFLFACGQKADTSRPRSAGPTIVDVLVASTKPMTNSIEVNGTVVANEYR